VSASLGDWVRVLNEGRPFFHLADLMKLGHLERDAARKAAQRLLARRLLLRVGPELYANGLRPPSLEAAACALRPAYISLEHALFLHGVLDQAPAVVTCVTLGRPGRVTTGLGELEFHRIAPRLYTGFEATPSGLLATPEKALLDLAYLRRLQHEREPFGEPNLENLNRETLTERAAAFPSTVQRWVNDLWR
jgi:predicted transcriptional regulator of viral defense system